MQRSLGWIMLLAGIFILVAGSMFPMVSLYVDTTPPTWIDVYPKINDIVPSSITPYAKVRDLESGVDLVWLKVDADTYGLPFATGTEFEGEWRLSSPLSLSTGIHQITWGAKNKAGQETTAGPGNIEVYVDLQGKWYINNIEITSTSQTVYSTSNQVTFKFAKTVGVADDKITAGVWVDTEPPVFGTSGGNVLAYKGSGVWESTLTIANGKHTAYLVAGDGIKYIKFSIIGMQVGPEGFKLPQLNMLQIFGLASTGIGLLLIFTGKKVAGKKH